MIIYKRLEFIIQYMDSYLNIRYLNSFIIIWNDVETQPSIELKNKFNTYLESKKLKIIVPKINSLSNRFVPYDIIETESILILDDDVKLETDHILFGFRIWRENRHRLVGIVPRSHSWDFNVKNFLFFIIK